MSYKQVNERLPGGIKDGKKTCSGQTSPPIAGLYHSIKRNSICREISLSILVSL